MANPYSAETAKKQAESYLTSVGGQLTEVLGDISRASFRGSMKTTMKGLSEFTVKALEIEGYQVLPNGNHEGYWEVSWENPKSINGVTN